MYDHETRAVLEAAREYRAAYIRDAFRAFVRRPAPALGKHAHAG